MNLDKYTQKAQEAVAQAQELAQDLSHQTIEPAHLLMALLKQEEWVVPAVVTSVAGSVAALQDDVQRDLDSRPKVYGGGNNQAGLSRPAADVLNAA